MSPLRARRRQAGLTMVEIMVSVLLVGIAIAFVFSIQIRVSTALRDQSTISEVQQTLRASSDLLVKDLRMAGYLAKNVYQASLLDIVRLSPKPNPMKPITVFDGGADPDTLTIIYSDPSASAVVDKNLNPSFTAISVVVDTPGGFTAGDTALATHTTPIPVNTFGLSCLMSVTGKTATTLIFNPLAGAPWNLLNNLQCLVMSGVWNDGYTMITKVVFRSYRIKPNDQRGVLQMSATGAVLNDWQDLALGIVDLQVALRVYIQGDATDEDGDGDPERDWFSGGNMETLPANAQIQEVSLTLVAKSTKEIAGATLLRTPDLIDPEHTDKPDNNRVGNVAGTSIGDAGTTSMYAGSHAYRTYTTTVDLRNAGTAN